MSCWRWWGYRDVEGKREENCWRLRNVEGGRKEGQRAKKQAREEEQSPSQVKELGSSTPIFSPNTKFRTTYYILWTYSNTRMTDEII